MLLVVAGVVLGGVSLLAAILMLAWILLKKTAQRSVDVTEEFKGISSRPSFRNAIHQSFVNQTQNTAAVIYTLDEFYGNATYGNGEEGIYCKKNINPAKNLRGPLK